MQPRGLTARPLRTNSLCHDPALPSGERSGRPGPQIPRVCPKVWVHRPRRPGVPRPFLAPTSPMALQHKKRNFCQSPVLFSRELLGATTGINGAGPPQNRLLTDPDQGRQQRPRADQAVTAVGMLVRAVACCWPTGAFGN